MSSSWPRSASSRALKATSSSRPRRSALSLTTRRATPSPVGRAGEREGGSEEASPSGTLNCPSSFLGSRPPLVLHLQPALISPHCHPVPIPPSLSRPYLPPLSPPSSLRLESRACRPALEGDHRAPRIGRPRLCPIPAQGGFPTNEVRVCLPPALPIFLCALAPFFRAASLVVLFHCSFVFPLVASSLPPSLSPSSHVPTGSRSWIWSA